MTVGRIVAESLIVAGWERPRIATRVEELLRQVRLEPEQAQLYDEPPETDPGTK
jgi:ABC-type proline/glycine betaine transport system ATPase subunit